MNKEDFIAKNNIVNGDDINLIELTKVFKRYKKLFVRIILVFMIIGVVIALASKVEYESYCKLMPESQESMQPELGGLGGLVGLAGINLNMGQKNVLTPELYPQIAKSVPFLLKIWDEPIHFEKQDTISTSYIFFKEIDQPSFVGFIYRYTLGLPTQIRRLISKKDSIPPMFDKIAKNDIIQLNRFDYKLLERFQERIAVYVDSKTGIITISALMPDAQASAELVEISYRLLKEYITDYKISKAQENLDFIQARYDESKSEFMKSQERLAIFSDRNQNVVTAYAQTETERLRNEYNIAFEVYKGLANQLEQAKITVKEETPVFIVLEPVKKPVEKSKPKRIFITIGFIMFGIFVGSVTIFIKYFIIKFKHHLR